jgi:hypothetical protein
MFCSQCGKWIYSDFCVACGKPAGKPVPCSTVEFGRYFIKDETERESMRWSVLSVEYDRVLLITEKCIEIKWYHCEYAETDWEHCSLREWLNHDFMHTAFNSAEQKRIPVTVNENNSCNRTADRIFLLSIDEAGKLFHGNMDRKCEVTPYVRLNKNGVYNEDLVGDWLLRSAGLSKNLVAFVACNGEIREKGCIVQARVPIRPAVWVKLL